MNNESLTLLGFFVGLILVISVSFFKCEKKDRGLILTFIFINVLLISSLLTTNFAIQLLELAGIIILVLYVVFALVYPKLFIEKEELYYQPRRRTVWEDMKATNKEEEN